MNKAIENLKNGNYEVVDNQGVSVTIHFVECLGKEFADLEVKLAEKDEQIKDLTECNKYLQIYRNKDKILFAVVLLKKLKELFLIQSKEYPIVYNISDDIVGGAFDRDKCFDIIDNEIEILKRMVSK